MPKKEIIEKLDKVIENILDAILVFIEKGIPIKNTINLSEGTWKLVNNNVRNLSTLIKLRERIDKLYAHQNQGLDPLMFLLMSKQPFNKINDPGSREDLIREIIKEMMSGEAVKGTIFEDFYNLIISDKLIKSDKLK